MITNEEIKALAIAHGFKLSNETGDDLKTYVYEFSRGLIALAQQVKPLASSLVQIGDSFSSEQYAIEIAQDIHKAKILKELTK